MLATASLHRGILVLPRHLNRVRERFYWKGMVADVRGLVSSIMFLHQPARFVFPFRGEQVPGVPTDK